LWCKRSGDAEEEAFTPSPSYQQGGVDGLAYPNWLHHKLA